MYGWQHSLMCGGLMTIYLPLLAALCGAITGGTAAWIIEYWRRRRDSAGLLNILFAELRNIQEHYRYAAGELPKDATGDQLALRTALAWAKYGDVVSMKSLQSLGFIGTCEVQLLLQIALRIRNTDTLLALLLDDLALAGPERMSLLHERSDYIHESVITLLESLLHKNPKFTAFGTTPKVGALRA